jgi:uncharacterized protein (DUF983 family)
MKRCDDDALVTAAHRVFEERIMSIEGRNWKTALLRGLMKRCPSCGRGLLFSGYTKTHDSCSHCGQALHHHRADDAPPYFTIMVVGHTVVPLLLLVEKVWAPPLWVHGVIWLPMTLLMTLWLLPIMKGATIGVQWALGMHGFGETADPHKT